MATRTITECEVCKREIKSRGMMVSTDRHVTPAQVHPGECLSKALDVLREKNITEIRLRWLGIGPRNAR